MNKLSNKGFWSIFQQLNQRLNVFNPWTSGEPLNTQPPTLLLKNPEKKRANQNQQNFSESLTSQQTASTMSETDSVASSTSSVLLTLDGATFNGHQALRGITTGYILVPMSDGSFQLIANANNQTAAASSQFSSTLPPPYKSSDSIITTSKAATSIVTTVTTPTPTTTCTCSCAIRSQNNNVPAVDTPLTSLCASPPGEL